MADDYELLERAFDAGATSVTVRRRGNGTFGASISAFVSVHDGKRSKSTMASADGEGQTAESAIRDALAQLSIDTTVAEEPAALEAEDPSEPEAIATQESSAIELRREVITPEILDPHLRYAVVGRPGQFVTRDEARGVR